MSGKEAVVVEGEASETDSEDEESISLPSVNVPSNACEVVAGEAPETDSEDENDNRAVGSCQSAGVTVRTETGNENNDPQDLLKLHSLPSLKVEPLNLSKDQNLSQLSGTSPSTPVKEQLGSPMYDTLLHRKLRDNNAALLVNIHESVEYALHGATKEMQSANMQMNRSQIVIQDVCQLIRNFSKDLNKVTEKLEVINSTPYIPVISIASPPGATAGSSSS